MNASRLSAAAVAAAALFGSSFVSAQDVQQTYQQSSFGAPQPGVEVPGRYSNPQQSQQLLQPAPAQVQQQGVQNSNGVDNGNLREIEGEDASSFMMNSVVGLSVAGGADASEIIIEGSEIYMGVTPDHRDTLPHITPYQNAGATSARNNQLTWLGFQPLDDRTRVFVQTGRPAQYRVVESPDGMTVTVELRDTRIGLSNFMRFVDASHFDRPVSMIRTSRTSDGVTQVSIELARGAQYEVVPDGNYLYVDFTE